MATSSRNRDARWSQLPSSLRSRTLRVLIASAVGLAAALSRDAIAQGAATFESGERLYRPQDWRLEDIPVPHVQLTPDVAAARESASEDDPGPRFEINRFDVTGDTLLGISEIERQLSAFVGPEANFARVEAARDALQKRYEDEGFLWVTVGIPPQNVDSGAVALQVVEGRLGAVTVENEGRRWVDDERVRALVPNLRSGALLRQAELQEELVRANAQPDLVVQPVIRAGREPGTVDVTLQVQDRIPLHGFFQLNNQYTPGSPDLRGLAQLSYGDLWERSHEASLTYVFAPTDRFSDFQVYSASYSVPRLLGASDQLSLSGAYSASESGIPGFTRDQLATIGKGLSLTFAYQVELPSWDLTERGASLGHGVSVGLDLKDIESTLSAGIEELDSDVDTGFDDVVQSPDDDEVTTGGSDTRPIRYNPLSLGYWLEYAGPHAQTSVQLTSTLHRLGFLGGDGLDEFLASAGRPRGELSGDFAVLSWDVEHRLRLGSALQALRAGRWLWDTRSAERGLWQDWSLSIRSTGQWASEPLIPTEKMPGGGVQTVRGYLEAEGFGDSAFGFQLELESRPVTLAWTGRVWGSVRFALFYDEMRFWELDVASGPDRAVLRSWGLAARAQLGRRTTAELIWGMPLDTTTSTDSGNPRLDFRLGYGF